MQVNRLKISNLRNLGQVDMVPGNRLNVLYGGNGAGKTSVLESLVVLSRGRSFRTSQVGELIGPAGSSFSIFAEISNNTKTTSKVGLERSGKHWRARKDGEDLRQLSMLTRSVPLVLLEPNSHLLVSGAPEYRRKFLDWGVFHVEHQFLDTYRRFTKILKQRNAALRKSQINVLDSVDTVLAEWGQKLSEMRASNFDLVFSNAREIMSEMNPGLEGLSFEYKKGWSREFLRDSLQAGRERDLINGMTGSGPHRADVLINLSGAPARNILSRGEQKVLSAALLISQAETLAKLGDKPIVLLDDLASEFDEGNFNKVMNKTLGLGGQVWITGTRAHRPERPHTMFHVEHGTVKEVV